MVYAVISMFDGRIQPLYNEDILKNTLKFSIVLNFIYLTEILSNLLISSSRTA